MLVAMSPLFSSNGCAEGSPRCPVCERARTGRLFARRDGVSLWRCKSCGLGFIRPLPHVSHTEEHFSHDYIQDEAVSSFWDVARVPQIKDILQRVEAATPPDGPWLDIGSATGSLFQVALETGRNTRRFYSVEPSHIGRQAIERLGVPTCRDVRELPTGWPERYAVVSLLDMLYFVPDPLELLVQATALLAPMGVLAVDVPTFGYEWTRGGGLLVPLRLGHLSRIYGSSDFLYYFTRRSLQIALSDLGLRDQVWSSESATYDIHRGFRRFTTLLVSAVARTLDRVIPSTISVAPKLLVLARRRALSGASPSAAGLSEH